MGCKSTSIKARGRAAFTLVEVMVASALALIVVSAIAMLSYFSTRSFMVMANYTTINEQSQLALDKMSKDIRQARRVTAYATNSLTFEDADGNSLRFTYDPNTRSLVRVSGGNTVTYLTDCEALNFWIYQHTMISNTFDCYTPAAVTNARVVQVTWKCARSIRGIKSTTASVQSAKTTIRNH
jgi:prepilin-type N-terminal cleavage/methylation domain-containing protein